MVLELGPYQPVQKDYWLPGSVSAQQVMQVPSPVKAPMPSFTEATVTLGTIPLGLCSAPEHIFANPAIRPLTLFYTVLIGFRRLSDIGCFYLCLCLTVPTTAHLPSPRCAVSASVSSTPRRKFELHWS